MSRTETLCEQDKEGIINRNNYIHNFIKRNVINNRLGHIDKLWFMTAGRLLGAI
jgi:hypothetical protein